jgi:Na+-translocating ferredoxin:NAD+ oxidoreductase RnfG subunit
MKSALMQVFVEIVMPFLATVVTALAALVVQRLQAKYKVELDEAQDQAIRSLVRKAIFGAEEWAARRMGREKLDRIPGIEKAQRVLDSVKKSFPKIADERIMDLIDEEIATIKGLGSTYDAVGD